ncbi:hypothetical protein JOE25_001548 [Serratia sp. PL17]|jgi:hypothetical protein|nr:hypothetical protein [Serratia sp. PL17]
MHNKKRGYLAPFFIVLVQLYFFLLAFTPPFSN